MDTLIAPAVRETLGGHGLCFGTGLAPQGERVEFVLAADRLRLWPDTSHERSVPYRAIKVEPGGFERRQFQLTWSDDGPWALVLNDDALARSVRTNPPPGLQLQIERLEARARRGRAKSGVRWTRLAVILLAPLLLLALFWWQGDRIVNAAVARIPVSWEERLGQSAFEQRTRGATFLLQGGAAEAVNAVGERLAARMSSSYRFQWHVVDNPQINAFATPGGHVVVFTGLLNAAESSEEVAGVLAHEAQHVVLRHGLTGVVRSLGWSATIQILFGSAEPLSGVDQLVDKLDALSFSQAQETEADIEGLRLLQRAEIDPKAMLSLFEKLGREEPGLAWSSTHPMTVDRAARLRAEIAKAWPWPTQPLPAILTSAAGASQQGSLL